MIGPWHATLLGVVEGLTEFLPISSTGHLILVSRLLGLEGDAVNTFDVVIQAGALAAVVGLYWDRVASLLRGLTTGDVLGRRLLVNLLVSFLPAAVVGIKLHHVIKARLFAVWPVVGALVVGGVVMILVDRWLRHRGDQSTRTVDSLSAFEALLIGLAQCVSLWPGTSRAMVTILAGLLLGLPATAAAEYSFLLAIPTLGAATLFDAVNGGPAFLHDAGGLALACGFISAALVAVLAVRGFIRYLTRRGLAPFGWYRVALAILLWIVLTRWPGRV